jgi:hypothetical protein
MCDDSLVMPRSGFTKEELVERNEEFSGRIPWE